MNRKIHFYGLRVGTKSMSVQRPTERNFQPILDIKPILEILFNYLEVFFWFVRLVPCSETPWEYLVVFNVGYNIYNFLGYGRNIIGRKFFFSPLQEIGAVQHINWSYLKF